MKDINPQQELHESLIDQIEKAFSGVIFTYSTLYENPSWQLQGKHWREIPLEMLKKEGLIYGLPMTETGQFFLPAYMVALLTNPEEMEEYIVSFLLIFAPKPNIESDKRVPFAYLNKAQKRAVLAFLEAFPNLFPPFFEVKSYPNEVNEHMSEVLSNMGPNIPLPRTPYELWEEAVAFWKGQAENP